MITHCKLKARKCYPSIGCLLLLGVSCFAYSGFSYGNFSYSNEVLNFTEAERISILTHGPWPMEFQLDKSNQLSGNQVAIEFGKNLFFDPRLSNNKKFSCASCHQPEKNFTDGLDLSRSADDKKFLHRNTPSLLNLAHERWFGWGGESDSLWSHSIRPLLAKEEMGNTPETIKTYILSQPDYKKTYSLLLNQSPKNHSSEQVLVNIAKTLAAFQETLITGPSSFDQFRNAMKANDTKKMAEYPLSAQRGLQIFIGKGRCNVCHIGGNFSNGEFSDIGIPFFVENGVDFGRYQGIETVKASPYNRLGKYSDTQEESQIWWTKQVYLQHKNFGEFKVPSLRNIALTGPYMHNGSLATLEDVINHYDNIDLERLHADGESILQPLNLSQQERSDLLSFLVSLTSP